MNTMDAAERERFDALVETEVAGLPYAIQLLLQETPLLVEDGPSALSKYGPLTRLPLNE